MVWALREREMDEEVRRSRKRSFHQIRKQRIGKLPHNLILSEGLQVLLTSLQSAVVNLKDGCLPRNPCKQSVDPGAGLFSESIPKMTTGRHRAVCAECRPAC